MTSFSLKFPPVHNFAVSFSIAGTLTLDNPNSLSATAETLQANFYFDYDKTNACATSPKNCFFLGNAWLRKPTEIEASQTANVPFESQIDTPLINIGRNLALGAQLVQGCVAGEIPLDIVFLQLTFSKWGMTFAYPGNFSVPVEITACRLA
eukprot:CAMPEP_0175132400 /NCGR_PEP_ID=MMETSP0087-20121206/7056_1 /TAXON_ID=136419 /ORGANISM="Unknown Unknown, Strain D1" /LENGTH=150 /DNA_ID=CAMNT_0016414755 /DNA_START=240 /DNA_END=692 /DNA_ORIENTATION=+